MATSVAFLLLGLKADLWLLFTYAPLIIAAFLAILVSRFVSVYPIVGLTNLTGEKIPSSWTKVLAMAGLRGAVSVGLALSLADSLTTKLTGQANNSPPMNDLFLLGLVAKSEEFA